MCNVINILLNNVNYVFRIFLLQVRGILNKLTPENFQKLSDDLLKIDLNTKVILQGVIHLLFEKALDEPKYSSMYAQLCKRLSVEAPNFEENDKPPTFLTLLLYVCRDRFLNRSSVNHFSHDTDDEEKKHIAKQKMLGNVKFIGELSKLDMLTDDRLHICIQQLLDTNRSQTVKDRCEDMECLSQLIRTCGENLDTEKVSLSFLFKVIFFENISGDSNDKSKNKNSSVFYKNFKIHFDKINSISNCLL